MLRSLVGAGVAREAIFIGYRRDDTADVAGRIFDALAQRFGRQRIFKDVDNIGPGVDFGDYIKTVLPRCRVALVLIGPQWLDVKDESGGRRIDDQHDWVRVEIETALATQGLLVVPVLVNGARLPRAEEVPESLRPLLRRNAAVIRRDPDFHDDVERLTMALRASVSTGILDLSKVGGSSAGTSRSARPWQPLAALAALAVLSGFAAWQWAPWRAPSTSVQATNTATSLEPAQASEVQSPPPDVQSPARDVPASSPPAPRQTASTTTATTASTRRDEVRDFIIYFTADSSSLVRASETVVGEAAGFAINSRAIRVTVVGHDDTVAEPASAMALSERRARAVADALVAAGVRSDIISIRWRGESEPAVATGDGVSEPLNRRVAVRITF